MAETVQQHDFIELEYTGSLADGTVFDTTSREVAEKSHLAGEEHQQRSFAPVKICVGEKQVLPGLDGQLAGKEMGREYKVQLSPENAFGKRDIRLLRVIPLGTFMEHKTEPHPGMQVNVDGQLGIVSNISGGRVIVNFNHPLAGKEVVYTFTIVRKISDPQEKIGSYLQAVLQLPMRSIAVKVSGDPDSLSAEVEIPVALPAELSSFLEKKLTELVKIAAVHISKDINNSGHYVREFPAGNYTK